VPLFNSRINKAIYNGFN